MIQGHGDDGYSYDGIRLNFSSNIFAHADMQALKEHLCRRLDAISSYPEPDARAVAVTLAHKHGIAPECILVTNGATEAIYLIAQMLQREGFDRYMVQQPTFSEYADACRLYGMQPATKAGERVVRWVCNPNNPTGQVEEPLITHAFGMVVVDQSYEELTQKKLLSAADVVAQENIVQIHSLTKTYAVPGLRIGYVVAAKSVIGRLRLLLRPWSVNALAIEAAQWLIEHDAKAVGDVDGYLAEAQRLNRMLNDIPFVEATPTETNFMLARLHGKTAAELKDYLARRHHILIRDASNFEGLTPYHFRVAAQLPAENDLLVDAIRSFVSSRVSILSND